MAPAIFKSEANFFQDKIAGVIDTAPGNIERLAVNNLIVRGILAGSMIMIVSWLLQIT